MPNSRRTAQAAALLTITLSLLGQATPDDPGATTVESAIERLKRDNVLDSAFLDSVPPETVLTTIERHLDDPSPKIRSMCATWMRELLKRTDDPSTRTRIVTLLLKRATEDPQNSVAMTAASSLLSADHSDFDDQMRVKIEPLLNAADPPREFILLAGVAGGKALQVRLNSFLPEEAAAARPYNVTEWYARLALARGGDTAQIDNCIRTVEAEPNESIKITKLLADIAYIRQQKAVDLLVKYLNSDKKFPAGADTPEIAVAEYAAHDLSGIVLDFPLRRSGPGTYRGNDLETVRTWMKNNPRPKLGVPKVKSKVALPATKPVAPAQTPILDADTLARSDVTQITASLRAMNAEIEKVSTKLETHLSESQVKEIDDLLAKTSALRARLTAALATKLPLFPKIQDLAQPLNFFAGTQLAARLYTLEARRLATAPPDRRNVEPIVDAYLHAIQLCRAITSSELPSAYALTYRFENATLTELSDWITTAHLSAEELGKILDRLQHMGPPDKSLADSPKSYLDILITSVNTLPKEKLHTELLPAGLSEKDIDAIDPASLKQSCEAYEKAMRTWMTSTDHGILEKQITPEPRSDDAILKKWITKYTTLLASKYATIAHFNAVLLATAILKEQKEHPQTHLQQNTVDALANQLKTPDPFGGGTLEVIPTEDGFKLHSLGANLRNNALSTEPQTSDDLIFTFHVPK